MPSLDFWYEFASTYSLLAAMRVEDAAARAGVTIRWRPFLLGPVFAAQGWSTSPFNLYPAKGEYMWRDMARQAEAIGLRLVRPDPFPQNGLLAARVALVGHDEGWGAEFSRQVYRAEFVDGRQISDEIVIAEILTDIGKESADVLARALSNENKRRLREETDEARRIGVFGAPSFVTRNGELFWGNDRMGEALHWARHGSLAGFAAPLGDAIGVERIGPED